MRLLCLERALAGKERICQTLKSELWDYNKNNFTASRRNYHNSESEPKLVDLRVKTSPEFSRDAPLKRPLWPGHDQRPSPDSGRAEPSRPARPKPVTSDYRWGLVRMFTALFPPPSCACVMSALAPCWAPPLPKQLSYLIYFYHICWSAHLSLKCLLRRKSTHEGLLLANH